MRRIAVVAAVIQSLAAIPTAHAGNGSGDKSPALAPLAPLGERMEKIADAVIAGRDPRAVAGDWKLDIDPELARELKAAGAVRSRLTGYELDIQLGSDEQQERVSTIVHATPRATALLMLAAGSRRSSGMISLDQLSRAQQPFGDAARALLATSKGKGGCARLPMAGDELLAEIAPGPIGQELKKEGAASRDRACALLERGGTPVSIRVDDNLIMVLDKKGKPLGGIRSDIELDDGGVVFSLDRYRPL
jgi:hypothetical protein